MKEEEKKVLNESLSTLFKIDSETLASLYNEAGDLIDFSPILELDRLRIQKYKADADSQYKRGIKEGATKIEKELKEKYELESDLVGVELVDHLLVTKTEEAKTSSTKDITKHPDYIKLQVSIDKQLKDRDKDWEKKLEDKEREHNKTRVFGKVRERALSNLAARNPILPGDPRKAQSWREVYLNELYKADYAEDDEGNPIVLDAEGKALQSPHGKNITFDEFEKDIADKYFDYQKAEQRSSAGNKDVQQGSDFRMPKDDAEYEARVKDPNITPAERIKLSEYYLNKNQK